MSREPSPGSPRIASDGGTGPPVSKSPSERRASALFEAVRAPLVEYEFVEGTAVVRRTNDSFERTFGATGAIDRPLASVFDGFAGSDLPECKRHERPYEGAVERPTSGGTDSFSLQIQPLGPGDGGHHQFAVYRRGTSPEEYENKLATLHDATRDIIQQETRAAVARSAIDAAVDVLGFRASSVHLLDEERQVLAPTVTTDRIRDLLGDLPDLPPENSLAWDVLETGQRVVFDDVADNPDAYNPDTPLASELIAPLGDHGVLLAGSTEPDAFSDADVSLATILADNTEAALDRITREGELAERERQLERKNERLEAFASMVSHDIRNPLTVAQGCLELARMDDDMSRLDDVADAHDRMEALIEDLLEVARQGEDIGDVDTVSIAESAEQAWSLVETRQATLHVEDGIGTIEADRSRLAAALENLFHNAIEHGGDDVAVRIGPTDDGFFVADDGPGIPVDEREHVFEIGHSRKTGGTGIGLAVVADVASAHGWDVSVTESADGGACFVFSLTSVAES